MCKAVGIEIMNVKCVNQCLAHSRTAVYYNSTALMIHSLQIVSLRLKRSVYFKLSQACVWKGRTL